MARHLGKTADCSVHGYLVQPARRGMGPETPISKGMFSSKNALSSKRPPAAMFLQLELAGAPTKTPPFCLRETTATLRGADAELEVLLRGDRTVEVDNGAVPTSVWPATHSCGGRLVAAMASWHPRSNAWQAGQPTRHSRSVGRPSVGCLLGQAAVEERHTEAVSLPAADRQLASATATLWSQACFFKLAVFAHTWRLRQGVRVPLGDLALAATPQERPRCTVARVLTRSTVGEDDLQTLVVPDTGRAGKRQHTSRRFGIAYDSSFGVVRLYAQSLYDVKSMLADVEVAA